jgi:hypothetical protein
MLERVGLIPGVEDTILDLSLLKSVWTQSTFRQPERRTGKLETVHANDKPAFRQVAEKPTNRPSANFLFADQQARMRRVATRTGIHRGFSRERIDQSALQVSCGELLSLVDRE